MSGRIPIFTIIFLSTIMENLPVFQGWIPILIRLFRQFVILGRWAFANKCVTKIKQKKNKFGTKIGQSRFIGVQDLS